jgi:hypothetical protein
MGERASGFSSALPSRVAAIVRFTDVERPAIKNRTRPLGGRLRTQGRDYLNSAETSDGLSSSTDAGPALHGRPSHWSAPSVYARLPHLKKLDDCLGQFLVRVVCEFGARSGMGSVHLTRGRA